MDITRTGGLTAICLGAAMLMAVPTAEAGNAGVNIIYPPKLASDFDKSDEEPVRTTRTEVKVNVTVRPSYRQFWRERRRWYTERALFQNYVGFRKQYSGRRYPF